VAAMPETPATRDGVISFGSFEVDLCAGELRKQGVKIKLQDQPFQVLQVLLERPGEVVTRDELQKSIWPADTFVDFDHGISNAINRVREALGDTADNPRFIETLPRKGYRFVGVVKRRGGQAGSPPASNQSKNRELGFSRRFFHRAVVVGAGTAAIVLAVYVLVTTHTLRHHDAREVRSLAVLPLRNLSPDPTQAYFADGLTDALITDLAQIGSLKVISGTSTVQYKDTRKTIPEIARELGVEGIVEGTVQRSGERVRITAQLLNGPADRHLWASSYERDLRDLLSLESEVAGAIAHQIEAKLTPAEQARLATTRKIDFEAFEAYLQGKFHVGNAESLEYRKGKQPEKRQELQTARDFFQKAIDKDPNYALAYVGLAETWTGRPASEHGPQRELEYLQKAVALDPSLAEAHAALGSTLSARIWNWSEAEQELKSAIELNPNSAQAHREYMNYLDNVGRFEEGMREYLRVQELDPGGIPPQPNPLYIRRQFEKAIELDNNDIARHAYDFYPHWDLALNYEALGRHDEAVREFVESIRLIGYGDDATAIETALRTKGYRAAYEEVLHRAESKKRAGEYFDDWFFAMFCSFLGEKDRAFYWLDKSVADHETGVSGLKVDPYWDGIRADPRFQDLLRRVGLSL
jgi:TolB-like protein/DNA-binding winged helix-turn-helix (wHTH) protein